MSKMDRPEPGTPEFDAWLNERAKQWSEELFSKAMPEDLADVGIGFIAGPVRASDLLPEKTISEDIALDKAQKRAHLKKVK